MKKQNGYQDIARELRNRWKKNWTPGLRLPTYREVQIEFDTTPVTVQRAMNLLLEQGYIRTRPTVGSFLVEHPPYRSQVGLVFPHIPESPSDTTWSRGYLALLEVASRIDESREHWSFHTYLAHPREPKGGSTLKVLKRDVRDQIMAGLIFSYIPYELQKESFWKKTNLPVVQRDLKPDFPGLSIVRTEKHFLFEACQLLKKRKIHDIAVLTRIYDPLPPIVDTLESLHLQVRPEWIQATDIGNTAWIPHSICALFKQDGRKTPKALVITDDHLVEPTVNALLSMNIPADNMPMIVGYWNFPLPYSGALPIVRMGFDANRWLRGALELIDLFHESNGASEKILRIPTMHIEESGPDAAPGDMLKLIEKAWTRLTPGPEPAAGG